MQVTYVIRSCVIDRNGESDLPASSQVVCEMRLLYDYKIFKADSAISTGIKGHITLFKLANCCNRFVEDSLRVNLDKGELYLCLTISTT